MARARGLKALQRITSGPDTPFVDRRKRRIRWRRIDLTQRQAREFYRALARLEAEFDHVVDIARLRDPLPKGTRALLWEVRRRMLVAGLDSSDEWPNE